MTTHKAHRLLGIAVLLFVAAHIGNHFALFLGVESHLAVQESLRVIYRHPIVEPLLLLGVLAQIVLGLKLLYKRGWPKRFWLRMQSLSGLVMAAFLTQHISAVLWTRLSWDDVDTNIYWAASVVSRAPHALYFMPYYALGMSALFLHFAAFIAVRKRMPRLAWSILCGSVVLSVALVATLSGAFFPIELPEPYVAYIEATGF